MPTGLGQKPIVKLSEPLILGSVLEFKRDQLGFFERLARECGEIGRFHLGPRSAVFINSVELFHKVWVEQADQFGKGASFHRAFDPVVGKGLINSEGELHARQRKIMAPVFQPRNLAKFAPTIVDYAERAQKGWDHEQVIDLSREMISLTMSIISKVLFNLNVSNETNDLATCILASLNYSNSAFTSFIPIPYSWPTPLNRRTKRAMHNIYKRMQVMIEERRNSKEEYHDLLSLMLHAQDEEGYQMSDQQLMDEAVTLFGAGHETTASSVAWAFYLLTQDPECYAKVQQEITGVLQGRNVTYEDLANLPYTLQVFKEAMRLYPPIYANVREAKQDVEVGDYLIHKGETVVAAAYTMHRRPDYFPEPEKFEPDRFNRENEKKLPRYAYQPFGAGARICIGNNYALMNGHLLLATLAQRIRFELVAGQQIEPNPVTTLRSKFGIKVKVQRLY